MHQIFTPQSLVQYLYSNSDTVIDEDFLNEVFADDYMLSQFEAEAEKLLSKQGRKCEPSDRVLLTIDQMAGAARKILPDAFTSWTFSS
jgi:hypothetical protein